MIQALGRDLLGQFTIYEKESKEYFDLVDAEILKAKALTADVIKIAAALCAA